MVRGENLRTFIISENDAGQRVDKFLTKAVPLLPKGLLYKAIRTKKIKLNRKRCEAGTMLKVGDSLELWLCDDLFTEEKEKEFLRTNGKINIVYEDENILLVNKPSGLVVHEDDEHTTDTLINRILKYLYDKGEFDPDEENSFTPSLCNRIDRNTSGIVIAAKNAEALRLLNMFIKERLLTKQYLCLVEGTPKPRQDTLIAYLQKDSKNNKVFVSDSKTEFNKTIVTKYEVLKTNKKISLMRVTLITGRTHQIRAHFAHIGHPLVGDAKYGNNAIGKTMGLRHQALCAYRLRFELQDKGEKLSYLDGKTFEIRDVGFNTDLI